MKKNPDEKGEGGNVNHSEDLVGIQNTVIHHTIKIKPEPGQSKSKSHLQHFNRCSSKIPNDVLEMIKKYGKYKIS